MFDNTNINTGGSFRVKRIPFTQVSNSALRDENLSLKAKGLYSLIQSYITIPDFTLYKGHLMSLCKEKRKAFDSAWKELKVNGYLKQFRIPKGENDSFVYEYDLLDVADLTTPALVNLNKNGEIIQKNDDNADSSNENSHTPHLVPYAKSTLCQRQPMPNGGGIRNTDPNNTYPIYIESKSESTSDSTDEFSTIATEVPNNDRREAADTDDTESEKIGFRREKEPSKTATPAKANGSQESSYSKKVLCDDYTTYREIIQDNIEYSHFLHNRPSEIDLVDELVNCMLDVICTKGDTVKINGEDKSRSMVISQYLKIDYMDIDHIIERYKQQHHRIKQPHAYLKTMLYTIKQECGHYYTNRVEVDRFDE